MAIHPRHRRHHQGFMLLEVLIAMLIFALGVLGLVGLQASAVQQSSQAKYRTDATLLANELIGAMWVGDRTPAGLSASFGSEGEAYKNWAAKVAANLPGAGDFPPLVTMEEIPPLPAIVGAASGPADASLTSSTRVTITVRWKAPTEAESEEPHNVILIAEIR
jgi:type IV pilus assembly protein PilV